MKRIDETISNLECRNPRLREMVEEIEKINSIN